MGPASCQGVAGLSTPTGPTRNRPGGPQTGPGSIRQIGTNTRRYWPFASSGWHTTGTPTPPPPRETALIGDAAKNPAVLLLLFWSGFVCRASPDWVGSVFPSRAGLGTGPLVLLLWRGLRLGRLWDGLEWSWLLVGSGRLVGRGLVPV